MNWFRIQAHFSADGLPEGLLSPQSPLDMPLGIVLPTRGQDPAPPTRYKKAMISQPMDPACLEQARLCPETSWVLSLLIGT